jgi:predicted GNAT family acetyltransferase
MPAKSQVEVTRELGATRGRYVGKLAGHAGEAELTFFRQPPDIYVADHTLTPTALRGRGIATMLVEHMVADARREGFRIRPLCPFVVTLFNHHADWSDVRA